VLIFTFHVKVVTVANSALQKHSDGERQLSIACISEGGHVKELVSLISDVEILEDVSERMSVGFYHLWIKLKVIARYAFNY
jgi:hypothetical protein